MLLIMKAHDYSINFRNKGITNYGSLIIVSLTSANFKCKLCASSPSEVEKNINNIILNRAYLFHNFRCDVYASCPSEG